jgi:predicted negative regulator of RcsB-dependent stress response
MERVKRFFRNHRRGMAVTAVVAGAGYLAYTYIRQKVKEVNEATSTERNDQEKFKPKIARD